MEFKIIVVPLNLNWRLWIWMMSSVVVLWTGTVLAQWFLAFMQITHLLQQKWSVCRWSSCYLCQSSPLTKPRIFKFEARHPHTTSNVCLWVLFGFLMFSTFASNNYFGAEGGKEISESFGVLKSLQKIDLRLGKCCSDICLECWLLMVLFSENNLGSDGCQIICSSLARLESLHTVSLRCARL